MIRIEACKVQSRIDVPSDSVPEIPQAMSAPSIPVKAQVLPESTGTFIGFIDLLLGDGFEGQNVTFGEVLDVHELPELHAVPGDGQRLSSHGLIHKDRHNGTVPSPRSVWDAVAKNGHRQVVQLAV